MRGLLTSLKIQSKWSSLKEIHQISSVKIAKSVLASAAHILKKNCKENGSIFAFYLTEICGIVIVYMHFFFTCIFLNGSLTTQYSNYQQLQPSENL